MDPVSEAAILYLKRKNKRNYPEGRLDNGGRWYPHDSERQDCCSNVRQPSRTWPWPLLKHCCSLEHVCNLYKVDKKEVRSRLSRKGLPLLMGSGDPWLDEYIEKNLKGAD